MWKTRENVKGDSEETSKTNTKQWWYFHDTSIPSTFTSNPKSQTYIPQLWRDANRINPISQKGGWMERFFPTVAWKFIRKECRQFSRKRDESNEKGKNGSAGGSRGGTGRYVSLYEARRRLMPWRHSADGCRKCSDLRCPPRNCRGWRHSRCLQRLPWLRWRRIRAKRE